MRIKDYRRDWVFDSKIAIVVREDLQTWQKLNVTAFLMSGIVGGTPGLIGELYRDRAGNAYHALSIQPVIVLAADGEIISSVHQRALERGVRHALYIEEMFSTGHDARESYRCGRVRPTDRESGGSGPACRQEDRRQNNQGRAHASLRTAVSRCVAAYARRQST